MHDMLLQKSDGTFELVVWDERLHGFDQVTVRFAQPISKLLIYDPTTGVSPTKTVTDVRSVPLTLSDHPLVIEVPSPR